MAQSEAKIWATGQAGHEVGGINKPLRLLGVRPGWQEHPVFEVRRLDGVPGPLPKPSRHPQIQQPALRP